MSSAQYDQALLAKAPTATKAQRQEGYSTDLLDSPSGVATPPLSLTKADGEQALAHQEYDGAFKKRIPFFRTRKGIFMIAVLVIVVIAAIIGGAVGGSVHHNQSGTVVGGTNSSNSTQGSPIGSSNSTNSTQGSPIGSSNSTNSTQGSTTGPSNSTNSIGSMSNSNDTLIGSLPT